MKNSVLIDVFHSGLIALLVTALVIFLTMSYQ